MNLRRELEHRLGAALAAAGAPADKDVLLRALEHDRGFYRSLLAERLDLRHTPELRFVIDETVERAMRLEEILRSDGDPPEVDPDVPSDPLTRTAEE